MSSTVSTVWAYFSKSPDNEDYGTCNLCQKEISRKGGSTSAMRAHLKSQHKSVDIASDSKKKGVSPAVAHSKPVVVQPRIKESLASAAQPKAIPKATRESINKSLAWMCAVDIRPMSVVDGRGFRNYSKKLNPAYVMPARKTVTAYVYKLYEEGLKELMEDIQGCNVGLTTDLWTSNANEGFITATAQYITVSWIPKTKVLGTRVIEGRHKVAEELKKFLTDYKIHKCVAVTTDNASNMIVACSGGDMIRVLCFAHTLQLAIGDGLKLGKKSADANTGPIQKAIA